jgi:hypothetical protein
MRKPTNSPILLGEVVRAIFKRGLVTESSHIAEGTLIRAEIKRQPIRVLVPRPGSKSVVALPFEKGSPGHICTSILGLEQWLDSLQDEAQALPFGPPQRDQ